jgi:hypothetical protein
MNKSMNILIFAFLLITTSCSTMNESLQLGAGMGAATGAAATYTAHATTGQSPSLENVALGAGVGLGIGLLTSYLTHKKVEEGREDIRANRTEMHFGDLPPSPFMIPKKLKGRK